MKTIRTLMFALTVFSSFGSTAQSNFGQPGADWYHSMSYGVFHSYYVSDTSIVGISAKRIAQKAYTYNPWLRLGLVVSNHPDLFVYSNADTVFAYNRLFGKFTPLYVFNVNAGDTVTLPVFQPETQNIAASTDSFFQFVVDSVKYKSYDTASLKTVFTSPVNIGGLHSNLYYGSDTQHRYAEKLGTVQGDFLPFCGSGCIELTTESIQPKDSLRCYHDPFTSITMVTDICGKDYSSVKDVIPVTGITVYPLPASETLNVQFNRNMELCTLSLYAVTGQMVLRTDVLSGNIVRLDVSNLPCGIYYLKLSPEDSAPVVRKIVVAR